MYGMVDEFQELREEVRVLRLVIVNLIKHCGERESCFSLESYADPYEAIIARLVANAKAR